MRYFSKFVSPPAIYNACNGNTLENGVFNGGDDLDSVKTLHSALCKAVAPTIALSGRFDELIIITGNCAAVKNLTIQIGK